MILLSILHIVVQFPATLRKKNLCIQKGTEIQYVIWEYLWTWSENQGNNQQSCLLGN